MKKHLKLFIPGPVDLWDETLEALSRPALSPFFGNEDWLDIFHETIDMLKQVYQTQNDIILMTAPGSGALETGIASLFCRGEKVILLNNGAFSNRLLEIMKAYRLQVICVEEEWGQAGDVGNIQAAFESHPDVAGLAVVANETSTGVRNPVQPLAELAHRYDVPILVDAVSAMGGYSLPVDAWGLDLVCTSSNKALEMSPGLGIASVSERAWRIVEAKKECGNRGWYYNLSTWKDYQAQRGRPYPTTPAVGLIQGLHANLKRILEHETLAGHWARIAWAQQVARAGLRNLGFKMLVRDEDASPTITTFCIRDDMANAQELSGYLAEKHSILLAAAFGPFDDKVMRFGHMGRASSADYLIPCLLGIENFVRAVKGVDISAGASLIGLKGSESWY